MILDVGVQLSDLVSSKLNPQPNLFLTLVFSFKKIHIFSLHLRVTSKFWATSCIGLSNLWVSLMAQW